MIEDFFRLAWGAISHQRIRSYLTVIGVVIGVAAVVALVAISVGMDKAIKSVFEKFGADKLIIMPGGGSSPISALVGKPFTDRELEMVKRIPEIKDAVGSALGVVTVEYRGKKRAITVTNIDPDKAQHIFEYTFGFSLESGSYFRSGSKYKAILGWRVAHQIFGTDIRPGATIYINGKKFRVVGVLQQIGSRQDDSTIYIPTPVFTEVTGKPLEYMMIVARLKNGADPDAVADKVKRKLKRIRGTEDFTVMTTKQLMERISTILGIVGIVLVGIAAVSLVVGGVGIMNTMYMSVMERTRYIGVMKAVGATSGQILIIFLIESALIGMFGGIIGVLLGAGVAKILELVAQGMGMSIFRAYLGPELLMGAVGFAAIVGVVAGFLPARHAAQLNPVEALRYE